MLLGNNAQKCPYNALRAVRLPFGFGVGFWQAFSKCSVCLPIWLSLNPSLHIATFSLTTRLPFHVIYLQGIAESPKFHPLILHSKLSLFYPLFNSEPNPTESLKIFRVSRTGNCWGLFLISQTTEPRLCCLCLLMTTCLRWHPHPHPHPHPFPFPQQ